MGFEVELKFRVVDAAALRAQLAARGFTAAAAVDHEDIYFAHPSRDFATTGEAFRIRGEGATNCVTYKGSKRTGPAKTREEIEVEFAHGLAARAEFGTILERLGFQPVATVRKRRTSYAHPDGSRLPLTVTLDEVPDLGTFAEVETLVAGEDDLRAAQGAVSREGAELGLTEVEPRSYLRMVLEASGTRLENLPGQTSVFSLEDRPDPG